jgi:NAD(P)-dependent dehydrogenase (short-subunit alcohol dehydrogenase family)
MGRLDGKVAFITGAARGQGRSHAVRLAQEGCKIIGLDLCGQIDSVAYPMATPDDLADTVRLVEEHDHRMVAEQADVRDLDRLGAVLQKGLKEFGRLDIVVANAGIAPIVGEQRLQVQAWNDAIDVMLTGVYHTLHATAPVLIEGGRGGSIVITSSTAGLKGFFLGEITAGAMGYTAAKHGVVGLMRAYANVWPCTTSGSTRCTPRASTLPWWSTSRSDSMLASIPRRRTRFRMQCPCRWWRYTTSAMPSCGCALTRRVM